MSNSVPLEGQELIDHINNLNARVLRGDIPSDEEIAAAVIALRSNRGIDSSKSKKKKDLDAMESLPLDLDDLFSTASPKAAKPKAPAKPKTPAKKQINWDNILG
jgi:hypothetical protein